MGDLPEPVADHCMLVTKSGVRRRLWVIGGSSAPQRYKVEVFAKDLDVHQSSWIRMPELLDKRMWQGCVETTLGYQTGILVVGGYYNGVSSMFLPLEDHRGRSLETFGLNRNMPRWEFVGGFTKVGRCRRCYYSCHFQLQCLIRYWYQVFLDTHVRKIFYNIDPINIP